MSQRRGTGVRLVTEGTEVGCDAVYVAVALAQVHPQQGYVVDCFSTDAAPHAILGFFPVHPLKYHTEKEQNLNKVHKHNTIIIRVNFEDIITY